MWGSEILQSRKDSSAGAYARMPVQHSPDRRPATRSQHPTLLPGVGKHPVALNTPQSTTKRRSRSSSSRRSLTEPPPPQLIPAIEPNQDNMVNGNGDNNEGGRGIPPALQNWEAFCQALYGHRPTLPEFHGRAHEDPTRYLQRCEEYFTAYQIPDAQKTKIVEKGLRSEAEKWWQCYKALDFEWLRYRALVIDKFDSSTVKSELTTSLYSRKQGEKESVGAFLQEKYLLFQRVQPDIAEEQKIQILLNLTKPSLRKTLRPVTINDFATLMSRALQAEKDDNEEQQSRPAKVTLTPKEEKPASSKATNSKTSTSKAGSYLPKCWYCPERHLHKDCDVYKARQSENWRQAPENPAAGANSNIDRKSTSSMAPPHDSQK